MTPAVPEPVAAGSLPSNVAPADPIGTGAAPRKRSRRPWLYGGLATLALLLVAAGTTAVVFGQMLIPSGFKAAAFLPRDTWALTSVTLRPGLMQSLGAKTVVDAFTKQPGYEQAVKALQSNATSSSVDFEKEILPLLDGEIALGASGSVGPDSTFVLVAHSKDPDKLMRLIAAANNRPEPRDQYKGGLEQQDTNATGIASPKGWIVWASNRQLAEQTIDRIEAGGPSIVDDPRYKTVVDRLPSDRLGYAYYDNRAMMDAPSVRRSFDQMPAQARSLLDGYRSVVGLSIATAPEGLELHWESVPERAATRPTDLPKGGALTALGRLPSDTLAAVGGDSLPTLLNGVDDAINQMMGGSGPFAPRIQFQFTHWLGGEFAAGMGPGSLRLNASGGTTGQADLLLTARVKDTTAAQTDVGALDRLLFAKPAQVGGVPMKQLGTGSSSAYYGLSDDWLYLLSGERPDRLVAPKLGFTDSLTTTPHYTLVKRALRDDAVVFYLDLEDGRRLMETMLSPAQQSNYEKSRVLLQPLRALGANFRTDPNGDVHGTILLAISG